MRYFAFDRTTDNTDHEFTWRTIHNNMVIHAIGTQPEQLDKLPHEVSGGELTGYRLWLISIDYHPGCPPVSLESLGLYYWWPQGTVTSEHCQRNSHRTMERSAVGYHCWKTKEQAMACLNETRLNDRSIIGGEVEMWGAVVEHENGYRAECMRILSLEAISNVRPDHLSALWDHYLEK